MCFASPLPKIGGSYVFLHEHAVKARNLALLVVTLCGEALGEWKKEKTQARAAQLGDCALQKVKRRKASITRKHRASIRRNHRLAASP
jgi:hypothetical protein